MPVVKFGIQITRRWLILAATAILVAGASCRDATEHMPDSPFYHCEAYDVWPDSIDTHSGFVVAASGDSLLQVKVEGSVVREIRPDSVGNGYMEVYTGMPVFDLLYRWEASRGVEGKYSTLTPYELYLNPLSADKGIKKLEEGVKNVYIVPVATRYYSWPVINDNPQWIMAACELYKVAGDRRWLDRLGEIAGNVVGEDCRVAYNVSTGLIGGLPRRMVLDDSWMPGWMEPVDLFDASSLTVNVAYWGALNGLETITTEMSRKNDKSHLPELPLDADKLRHEILSRFWMPNIGMMGSLCYGYPLWPVGLESADNFGQALAVVTGMLSDGMKSSVIGKTPGSADAVGLFSPQLSVGEEDADMLRATHCMWAIAASRTGNARAYSAAVGALLCDVASNAASEHTPSTKSLASLIIRGLLGMKFVCNGVFFAPVVPEGMTGRKQFKRIKYRDSLLNITIDGTGDEIETFTVDGAVTSPFVAASLSGEHDVYIKLTGNRTENDEISMLAYGVLPQAPEVEWMTSRDATITRLHGGNAVNSSLKSFVYLNGVVTDEVLGRHYRLYKAATSTAVQVCTMEADRYVGFSSRPYLYIPPGKGLEVELADWATKGTRVIEDRKLAERFVETGKWKNRVLKIEFDVAEDGDYAIDARYLNGLGIVNTRRRTALRSIDIDGERIGIWVFPQLCGIRRGCEASDDWQRRMAVTNPLKTHLTEGHHVLEMRLYQPNPVYIDPASNVVFSDIIRIYKI